MVEKKRSVVGRITKTVKKLREESFSNRKAGCGCYKCHQYEGQQDAYDEVLKILKKEMKK